ncbi:MAG: DNA repair protein RecN [Muribaculaceae bacterium]
MLTSLHISNYALIDVIDIDFSAGFNVITGETGAGKSIILGALSLILGGRADTKVLRDGGKKSIVEAIFNIAKYKNIKQILKENDLDDDGDNLSLRREITPQGRSRAFVNDTPVTLDILKEVALQLVDIHSQHQNLLLASNEYQLQIIDALADNKKRLEQYAEKYGEYRKAMKQYVALRKQIEQSRNNQEFMRFQLQRLDEANLYSGMLEELEHQRDILANVTEIKDNLGRMLSYLCDSQTAILSQLKESISIAEELDDIVDDASDVSSRLNEVKIELQDIAETYQNYDRNLNADPAQFESIENNLADLYDLFRRHNTNSVERLMEIAADYRKQLSEVDNADELLKELQHKILHAKNEALEVAREISEARKAQAEMFAADLRETAVPLGMKNLIVKIDVTQTELSPTGIDAIEFLFAFNKNQSPLPIRNSASGGEISRIMLSVKAIVAGKMQLPSIIFDEVDTGVSGEIAHRMGLLMQQISQNIQVIAITHLPQVAAKGVSHYKVFKQDSETETNTCITRLDDSQRIDEIALMLSGSSVNQAARDNAMSLLRENE